MGYSSGSFQTPWGATISWGRYTTSDPNLLHDYAVSASNAIGNSQSQNTNLGYGPGGGPITGSYSFSADVEEWCEIYALTSVDTYGFPTYGGAAADDGIPALGVRFYEALRPGGTSTASITFGVLTATATGTISSSVYASGSVSLGCNQYVGIGSALTGPTYSATASITSGVGFIPSHSWSSSTSSISDTATTGGGSLSVSINVTFVPGAVNYDTPSVSASGKEVTSYAYNARLRSFSEAFPSTQTITLNDTLGHQSYLTASPTASASISQALYNVSASLLGNPFSDSINQVAPVSSYLAAAGSSEDTRDWRLQFRGFKRDALTLAHAASTSLDDGTFTTNWAAGPNSAIAAVLDPPTTGRSAIQISASGGTGSATRSFPTPQVSEAYRYLRITARGTVAGNATIILASHRWVIPLTTSYQDFDLDLCCPKDETATKGTVNTRYPVQIPATAPTGAPPYVQYAFGWGVNYFASIQVAGVPDGQSVFVDAISLVRNSDARLTLLAPFLYWPLGWQGQSMGSQIDNTYVQPYLFFQSDRKGPIDLPQGSNVVPTGTALPYFSTNSISAMATMLNYFPGLTATNLSASSDGYHDNTLPSMLLGGAGATYDHGTQAWTDWIDVNVASGTLTIPAQDIFDEVQVYPGAGEVWTSGLYNVATALQVSKSLRGQANGLVFRLNRQPYAGITVTAYDAGATSVGSGVTGSLGQYLTGSPYGKGNQTYTTKITFTDNRSLSCSGVWQNRGRFRASFRGNALPCPGPQRR